MKVNVVTLTYSDRMHLLEPVLDALDKEAEIAKVIVVCNGIGGTSLNKLIAKSQVMNRVVVLDLGYNSGSAKGYKMGMAEALKHPSEFIWLLDDDNLPNRDALNILLQQYKLMESKYLGKPFCLLSFRPDRPNFKKAVESKEPYSVIGPYNSFLGFHIADKISKKGKALFSSRQEQKAIQRNGKVVVAPYGGMFFRKEMLQEIGYPNEAFFLYGDDYDFSYRITKAGGAIVCILDSKLSDLEKSFHLNTGKSKGGIKTRYFNTESRDTIFYSVRNGILFERNFINNRTVYFINKSFYTILLGAVMLLRPKHIWKYFIILRAIKESKNVQLNT